MMSFRSVIISCIKNDNTLVHLIRPPDKSAYKSAYWKNYFFLLLIQNICCGYSKEPSH